MPIVAIKRLVTPPLDLVAVFLAMTCPEEAIIPTPSSANTNTFVKPPPNVCPVNFRIGWAVIERKHAGVKGGALQLQTCVMTDVWILILSLAVIETWVSFVERLA